MKKTVLLIFLLILLLCACNKNNIKKEEPPKTLIETMSLEEKVAQMFLVHCPDANAVEETEKYQMGGYLLFAKDFKNETPQSIKEKIRVFQQSSKIPMFIAVDEEGGVVNRVSRYPQYRKEAFRSPRELYENGGMEGIAEDTTEKSRLLLSMGINLNLAPVCDVSEDKESFIYQRTLGENASVAAEYVTTVVDVMQKEKIGSCLKHFPGYGGNTDTHIGFAFDKRPYKDFLEKDFLPFRAGIEAGTPMVMVSHNIVECMDADFPASLSEKVHNELRSMGFSKIIITDDLTMEAVSSFQGAENSALLAVLAGNDMICCSEYEVQIPLIVEAVKTGKIPMSRIDESVERILQCKAELGLLPDQKTK